MGKVRVGKRGAVVRPARIRKKFGIEEGSSVVVEEAPDGLTIRPAVNLPLESWSLGRKAAVLLENAVDREDYERARREVRRMGLDPDGIPHGRPKT